MKKYRLNKDYSTPVVFIPKGTVSSVQEGFFQKGLYFGSGSESFYVSLEYAQQHPEWFEEVIEKPSDIYHDVVLETIKEWRILTTRHAADKLREKYIILDRKDYLNGVAMFINAGDYRMINISFPDGYVFKSNGNAPGYLDITVVKESV